MEHTSHSGMSMGQPKPPRHIFSKILTVLLFLLLIGAVVGIGYLYWQEMDKTAKLEGQVNEKQTALDKAKSEVAAISEPNAEYTAEVGKFKLTLDKNYYIVVYHDGPFEGGPVTNLTVGTKNEQGKQSITMPSYESVSINAIPASGGTKYEDWVKGQLNQDGAPAPKKLANIKVDGVDAEVYEVDELFKDRRIFFQKNGVWYEIKAGNIDSKTVQDQFDDVIKGFKFQS